MGQKEFSLIPREGNWEMIEIKEKGSDVRVYISNPPADVQNGLV